MSWMVQDCGGRQRRFAMKRSLSDFCEVVLVLRIGTEKGRIPVELIDELYDPGGREVYPPQFRGERFLEPAPDCSLIHWPECLKVRKFQCTEIDLTQCWDRKNPYYRLLARFVRPDFLQASDRDFGEIYPSLVLGVKKLCAAAGYTVEAYDNPLNRNGKLVDGYRALSINANAPVWMHALDGAPALRWDRPKNQDGAMKIPYTPALVLRINDDATIERTMA